MRSIVRNQRGQFVIIAALLVALMMLSLGPLLHEAATYYTREPWEEYLSLLGGLELNSQRLMEVSLINYTQTANPNILTDNLNHWQSDLALLYPGKGILLGYTLANGLVKVCGTNIQYNSGLNYSWYHKSSYSSAKAGFTLNMSSVGLQGYTFDSTVLLNQTIIEVKNQDKTIVVTVGMQDDMIVDGLGVANFKVTNSTATIPITAVRPSYNSTYTFVYTIFVGQTPNLPVNVTVTDQRGIKVISTFS